MDTQPKAYEDPSTAECFAVALLCMPFYFFFKLVEGQPFRGFVAALSAGVVMSVIWLLRPLWRNPVFWASVSGLAVAHVMLVFFLPYAGEFRFGLVFAPLVIVDIYFSARLIIFACGAHAD